MLRVQARTTLGSLQLDVELEVAAGLLRPARGRIEANGDTWLDTARGVDVPAERRRCG